MTRQRTAKDAIGEGVICAAVIVATVVLTPWALWQKVSQRRSSRARRGTEATGEGNPGARG